MKNLVVVYHSQTGNTHAMAEAVRRGATSGDVDGVRTRCLLARDAGAGDILSADALAIGTPENFGYMSGAIKDFLDRTYYPCEGKLSSLPYGVFISAGNDGRGALASIERIARGYPLKLVQEPIIARGTPTPEVLVRCEAMGLALAAGLELGVF